MTFHFKENSQPLWTKDTMNNVIMCYFGKLILFPGKMEYFSLPFQLRKTKQKQKGETLEICNTENQKEGIRRRRFESNRS